MPVTEAELAAAVIKLIAVVSAQAKTRPGNPGLLWHRCRDSRWCNGTPGMTDLTIIGLGGIAFRELKSQHGETSASQDLWLWVLSRSPAQGEIEQWGIWRPAHYEGGLIRAELETIAGIR